MAEEKKIVGWYTYDGKHYPIYEGQEGKHKSDSKKDDKKGNSKSDSISVQQYQIKKAEEEKKKVNKEHEIVEAKKKLAQLKRNATLKERKHTQLTEELTYDGKIVSKDIQPNKHKQREQVAKEYREARAKVREFEEQCKKQFGDKW